MRKSITSLAAFLLVVFGFASLSFAQDKLTILISGQSHASLYHCSCPYNPEGGVARRSTLISDIRRGDKNVLVLEAGGSFAGGNYDANTQTTDLDKQRTKFYLQSLARMGYDAFLVTSEEFNFGDSFLKEAMADYKLNYLSANLKGNFIPYIIKEFKGIKIAVIGLTDAETTNRVKAAYEDPKVSLAKVIAEVKAKKAKLIIVLSYLGEDKSKDILQDTKGVDIWVDSNSPFDSASDKYINDTLFIVPAWEVRRLTKINFNPSTLKAAGVEHISLNDDIKDDPKISSIIPICFTDKDCKQTGFIAKCEQGGTRQSKCELTKINSTKLIIIKPKVCRTCNIDKIIAKLKELIVDLDVQYLETDSEAGQELIGKLKIKALPAYLILGPLSAEFVSKISKIAKKADNYYILDSATTGISFILGREKISNRLDLLFDIESKDIVKTLDVLQEFKNKRKDIDVHLNFLAIEDPKLGLIAKGDKYEIEEFLRSACISKYYPDKLYRYLSCRLADIKSSWWEDCVVKFGMDPGKIKGCARTQEGIILLRDFIRLTQELEIVYGPTFLINNQEIFSSEGVPSVEEIEDLFKQ